MLCQKKNNRSVRKNFYKKRREIEKKISENVFLGISFSLCAVNYFFGANDQNKPQKYLLHLISLNSLQNELRPSTVTVISSSTTIFTNICHKY